MSRSRIFAWITIAVLAGGATTAQAQAPAPPIPSYYDQLQFNLTSPTAFSTAIGGYANPAVYGLLPGGETIYAWSDKDKKFSELGDWGLFLGGSHLGFGLTRSKFTPTAGGELGVTDWRIALADEHEGTSVGLGFGWTTGDKGLANRSNIFQVGIAQRFGGYVSFGLSGDFALQESYNKGLLDVAIRPLASDLLVLFGDWELPGGVAAKNSPWSLGAMADIGPGIQLAGRYFDDHSFSFSVDFLFGPGPRLAGSPRYNSDGDHTNTTYEVRLGFPDPSIIERSLRKNKSYVHMNMKGPVRYRRFRYFDTSQSLAGILHDIELAKSDPAVSGIAMNLSGMTVSRGKAWEIGEALKDFQTTGRHVVIYADHLGMNELQVASAADRIVFDPEGIVFIPGYTLSRTYVRDALDKLGIGFDEWRFLKYKSAMETFSRGEMSEADREQRYGLIEDFYATTRSSVASGRGIAEATFDEWVDKQVLISAQQALDMKIVDTLGRWDDVRDVIKDLEGEGKRYMARTALDGNRVPNRDWQQPPKVAVVYALGVCAMDSGIRARALEKVFLQLRGDSRYKAVVLRVDSPGGSAMASDRVAAALKKCAEKKPVVISQGDVAASGGYWLSMYGDKIFAQPGTITGSIGVIGGWIWNDGLGDKLGHTSDNVSIGKHADLFAGMRILLAGPRIPDRNMTPEERRLLMDHLKTFYEAFVDKVADGRGMTSSEVHNLAEGHVFSGVDGKKNGLIDEIGGLSAAIMAARELAGIDPDERVEIVALPRMPSFDFSGLRPVPGVGGWLAGLWGGEPVAAPETLENYEWLYLKSIIERPGRPLYMLPPDLYVDAEDFGAAP